VVGLRDQINQKPAIASVLIVGLILFLLGMIVIQLRGNRPLSGPSGMQSYFTTDDGRTWFADAAEQIPPFDHNGLPAVRCYVFETANSANFAGYLETYTQQIHDELTGVTHVAGPVNTEAGSFVKRPGDKNWVLEMSPAGQRIVKVKSPDGSAEPPQPVLP
jgi:hypothetical protein